MRQSGAMIVDTLASLGLSLTKVKNQRATEPPQVSRYKVTCFRATDIQKIRDHELHELEAMIRILLTSRPEAILVLKPFNHLLLFERLG